MKKIIFNDPIYGFITIDNPLIFSIIQHPYFQRLRRIRQLGLIEYVYPGALHTRFQHALGAFHLMTLALTTLREKGVVITKEEYEAACIAILLHDIGHGPLSHIFEYSILDAIRHESLSLLFMKQLNKDFDGKLDLAIQIFSNAYTRKFFYRLITGQLDIDRLDYLTRDSFFSGVPEGAISTERIINLLDVVDDQIVVEEKGLYNLENFLNARRLMYWRVYLHKTAVSAVAMFIQLMHRAKYLANLDKNLGINDPLLFFFKNEIQLEKFLQNPDYLKAYSLLDDYDIWNALKIWCCHKDKVLAKLSGMLLARRLFKTEISNEPFSALQISDLTEQLQQEMNLSDAHLRYFFHQGTLSNVAYVAEGTINIRTKKNEIVAITQVSDLPNVKLMTKVLKKYYICYPKNLALSDE